MAEAVGLIEPIGLVNIHEHENTHAHGKIMYLEKSSINVTHLTVFLMLILTNEFESNVNLPP